jgi:hypothetical protein
VTENLVLTGPLEQLRGVIGRYPEKGQSVIFEFDSVQSRSVHMVGVPRPLAVTFSAEGEVVREEVLEAWTGHATALCDRVVERRP